MKVPYDVVLPSESGSTMPTGSGKSDAPVALFLHGTRPRRTYGGMSFPGCTDGALHRTGSHRVRPIGKTRHRVSVCDMFGTLDAFLANAGISSAFVIAHDWGTRWHSLAARRPEFIRGLAFMEFSGPCLPGRIFLRLRAKPSEVQDARSGRKDI